MSGVERPQLWQLEPKTIFGQLINVTVRHDLLTALYVDYKRGPRPSPPPEHAPAVWDAVRAGDGKLEIPDPFLSQMFRQDINARWVRSVEAAIENRYPVPPHIVRIAAGASPGIRDRQERQIRTELKDAASDLGSSLRSLDPDALAEDLTKIRAKLTRLLDFAGAEMATGIAEIIELVDQSAKKHGVRIDQGRNGPSPG